MGTLLETRTPPGVRCLTSRLGIRSESRASINAGASHPARGGMFIDGDVIGDPHPARGAMSYFQTGNSVRVASFHKRWRVSPRQGWNVYRWGRYWRPAPRQGCDVLLPDWEFGQSRELP